MNLHSLLFKINLYKLFSSPPNFLIPDPCVKKSYRLFKTPLNKLLILARPLFWN